MEQIYTGDEIHFTDGTIWSCTFHCISMTDDSDDIVVFVPMSFKDIKEGKYCQRFFFSEDVKSLILDAIKGGAKIIRKVGLKID